MAEPVEVRGYYGGEKPENYCNPKTKHQTLFHKIIDDDVSPNYLVHSEIENRGKIILNYSITLHHGIFPRQA